MTARYRRPETGGTNTVLILRYATVPAGAPDSYGNAADPLQDANHLTLQQFPKAEDEAPPANPALASTIDTWLARRPKPNNPVFVLVHGYQYDPGSPQVSQGDTPFDSVYGSPPIVAYNLSWLPLVGECSNAGAPGDDNAIAFCYDSKPTPAQAQAAGWDHNYQHAALDYAPLAARALATVLAHLGTRPVTIRILAHSLGTRTTSQAIRLLRGRVPGNLDRVVLLDGAEFCVDAAASMLGQINVINIVNGADKVLDWLGESAFDKLRPNNSLEARVIGRDGLCDHDRWLDLQLDNPALIRWLADAKAPTGRIYRIDPRGLDGHHVGEFLLHWNCYTLDANRDLVTDLLQSDRMTIAALRAAGVPGGTNAAAHGTFVGRSVPPTPQTLLDRRNLLDPKISNL